MTILFGFYELINNMDSIQEKYYIPVFIAGALIFSGAAQILNYLRLSKKYGRLFKAQNELRRT